MNLNADQRKLVVFLGKMKLRELNSPFSSNVETFFLTFFKTFLKLFLTSPPPYSRFSFSLGRNNANIIISFFFFSNPSIQLLLTISLEK